MIKKGDISRRDRRIAYVTGDSFFYVLESFPPYLSKDKAKCPLDYIFRIAYHTPTESLIIANHGTALLCRAPKSEKAYVTHHIGLGIFIPYHGVELVSLGIVGNLENSPSIVVRPESACTPSFLFGSQRCDCYDQWVFARELAGHYNEIGMPQSNDKSLENYLREYFEINKQGIPIPRNTSQALLLIHLDSQHGMGSGAIGSSFNQDLNTTALLRHRGEYDVEQRFLTTMADGFIYLGLSPDPRRLNDNAGYRVTPIVLDYLGVVKPIILLTNNKAKEISLTEAGFQVHRVGFTPRFDSACFSETNDRREQFGHAIPDNETTLGDVIRKIEAINSTLKNGN